MKRLSHSTDPERDNRGYRRKHLERGKRMVDLFAEAISELGTTKLASAELGISYDYGKRLLLQIRKDLGAQAV